MNPWSRQIDVNIEKLKNDPDYPGLIKEDDDTLNFFDTVLVHKDKIRELAPEWAKRDFKIPNWRGEECFPVDGPDFIQWLGIITAINACYREPGSEKEKFWCMYKGKRYGGSLAMAACVTQAVGLPGYRILEADYLAHISRYEVRSIFGRDGLEIPFLYERTGIWNSVGRVLLEKYDGHFANLFEEANYCCFDHGNGICERLVKDFPEAFCDTRTIYGYEFPFHKKALLFPLMYYGRANDSFKLSPIKDIETISPLADYQVPRILHQLRILSYSNELLALLKKYRTIPKNSFKEAAIRLATVIAVKSFFQQINYHRCFLAKEEIDMPEMDFALWVAGRGMDSAGNIPHHITMSLDY
ncbi:queuosine salvage family protein [Patescibacteria group bacterium]|nr:queuosine salvage family protein [Patescibacteria group bacterium]